MENKDKTKEQLIVEIEKLNKIIVELEKFELEHKQADDALQENQIKLIKSNEELRQAKEKAVESEEKYKALYDNAPLSYQSLNEDGSFKDVNPTWLSTLGYNREEVLGKFYADFLHPDWKPHFEENFPAFKKRGYVNDVQFKIRHKDGHYLYISFEGCIGYYPDGSFKQTYCVFKDITKQKQAEEELAKYREQLEEMVNERTKELKDKNKELDNALKVFVGREMTIKKLQDRIKALGGK